jgi:uncharacterized protein YqeY
MSLHQDIKGQMIEAMKAKEAMRLSVIRGLLSSFTNELVAKSRKTDEMLSDEEVIALISRAVKQRKDSIEQFEKGGRADLAESEKEELAVLQAYLPAQMSREEVLAFVQAKAATENPTKEKAGQFMGAVMKELKGKTDGGMVKEAVDSLFA